MMNDQYDKLVVFTLPEGKLVETASTGRGSENTLLKHCSCYVYGQQLIC